MSMLCPVILAGGGGTRLWPLSRELYPKQFLSFGQQESMLQQTLNRLSGLEKDLDILDPLILCNEEHRFLVTEHAEEINKELTRIILEPDRRNTAPSLTVAALSMVTDDPIILMMPADHLIADNTAFHQAIRLAYQFALEDRLVTLGIKPTHPETGYGYIHCVQLLEEKENAWHINQFVEKPDKDTAERYISSGNYWWNSGMFMMKASVWLDAIKQFHPDILSACQQAYDEGKADGKFFRLDNEAYLSCPSDSIDYAVMEKIGGKKSVFSGALVELDAGWSDIGSWSAVWEINNKEPSGNVFTGDVIAEDTRNTIALSNSRLIATIGCQDLLVVETPDAVLVGDRNKSQDVKQIVDKLQQADRTERLNHTRVYRPWGDYETLDSGEKFQVKRLTVKPGKKLSLQLHHHRAEHWVVVKGVATVTRGEETFQLRENESTFIPLGTKHRLENQEETLLEVIEVQSGDYLGEDDIVRFEDDFGRYTEKSS